MAKPIGLGNNGISTIFDYQSENVEPVKPKKEIKFVVPQNVAPRDATNVANNIDYNQILESANFKYDKGKELLTKKVEEQKNALQSKKAFKEPVGEIDLSKLRTSDDIKKVQALLKEEGHELGN